MSLTDGAECKNNIKACSAIYGPFKKFDQHAFEQYKYFWKLSDDVSYCCIFVGIFLT